MDFLSVLEIIVVVICAITYHTGMARRASTSFLGSYA